MTELIINNIKTNYLIDENGNVFNLKTNQFLAGYVANTGYKTVCLTVEGKKKNYSLHRLVAQTFIPNPDNLPVVNHKDGNKINNTVENLEWVSYSQNRMHAIDTGISRLATGKREKTPPVTDSNWWKRYLDTNYMISKDGAVYNTKTNILLKQTPNKSGYIRYSLRIDDKSISKQAHILVMEMWGARAPESGEVVNHIDGNKCNNHIDNLEIVNKSENMLHACYVLKKNIRQVIRLADNKVFPSLSEAARQIGVTPGAISYAIKNNSRCHNSYWKYK